MTQEEKKLLLKDLSARLMYNVMLHIRYYDLQGSGNLDERDVELTYGNIGYCVSRSHWVDFKPYLRSISSMTEDEEKEYENCFQSDDTTSATLLVDFYNKHHFDYRGLIERGSAIEVTKENNPYGNL